jgi:NADH-quinone oxidoreductase subunit L
VLALLPLVIALPLAGFLVLVLWPRPSRPAVAAIGVGSVGAAMVAAVLVGVSFLTAPPPGAAYSQVAWQWMRVGAFAPRVGFYLDALSLVMMGVITVVGFLILLYSTGFMAGDEGYARFFAYMDLFVASMLILVLADNLLLLFLGWEGVGLCSYLLIGFWYRDSANGRAAIKAFVVTRVGDAALAVGLLLLFSRLGTLDIQELARRATEQWAVGSGVALAAAALLLAGAVGKSAQLPLQTWLPDAMAGPTPVSALIHAATMVTAGVYLIARNHALFALAPSIQSLIVALSCATIILSGFSAATQHDIKRVLAYSTISQVGYMFLALGVGAWSAGVFHLMTHAFFKALLFLGAGAVITSLRGEHDIFRMGGLRHRLPVTFWTFLVAALSLAGLSPFVAGFYSKDWILYSAWASERGGPLVWAVALAGVVLTSFYTFRLFFIVFFGEAKQEPRVRPGAVMLVPLVLLAVPAALIGLLETPGAFGDLHTFSRFMHVALPAAAQARPGPEAALLICSQCAAALGIVLAYVFCLRSPAPSRAPSGAPLLRFWRAGWGFDWLYDKLLVQPFLRLADANEGDFVDGFYRAVGQASVSLHRLVSATQDGRVRLYAVGIGVGAAVVVAMLVLL